MSDKIKIGQIGVCHEHAAAKMSALRLLSDVFEVVGVVDDRNTRAARRSGSGDEKIPYEGLIWRSEEELLSFPGLQAVVVETPNADLVPTAMRCMERNLPMHMDKPGGENLEDFEQLLNACEERQLPFQMGYMFRSNPAMQFCLKAVDRGWLGDVFEIQAGMSHDYGGEKYQDYLSNFKGGIMFNLGCHLIDFMVKMLGRPEKITPFLNSTKGASRNSNNNCLSVFEYTHTLVAIHACDMEADGIDQRRLKISGTKGSIELCPLEIFGETPLTMKLILKEGNDHYEAGTHIVDHGKRRDRYEEQLLELAQIIRGEIKNPYTYHHDHLVQEVLLAASGYTKWKH